MRTCRACGRENPDGRDFCECGEYLRWEPTGYVPAVSKPAPEAGPPPGQGDSAASAQDVDPNLTLAADAPLVAGRAWGTPAAPSGLAAGVRPEPGTPGFGDAPPGAAALLLRLAGSDGAPPGVVAVDVEPGQEATILGLIRNQSGVVDNFDLWIRGLPDGWWTITPETAYLVPYGTAGMYEQEIQIQIHPPRRPEAQARPWAFEVVAESRAYGGEVAAAAARAVIGP